MRLLLYFLICANVFSFLQIKTLTHNKYTRFFLVNKNDDYIPEVLSKQISYNSILLKSRVNIDTDIDTIWKKMTDYNNLSDFIPNLDKSIILSTFSDNNQTYTKVFQEGSKISSSFNFTASVIIDIFEENCEKNKKIKFMLDKSVIFSSFYGSWIMKCDEKNGPVELTYILYISPKIFIPLLVIESQIKKEIKRNLSAIKKILEE